MSKAHLQKELKHREAELAIIKSAQDGLASKMELQAIYDLVGAKIHESFGAQTTIIAAFDTKNETQYFNYFIDRYGREYLEPRPMSGLTKSLARLKKTLLFKVEDLGKIVFKGKNQAVNVFAALEGQDVFSVGELYNVGSAG